MSNDEEFRRFGTYDGRRPDQWVSAVREVALEPGEEEGPDNGPQNNTGDYRQPGTVMQICPGHSDCCNYAGCNQTAHYALSNPPGSAISFHASFSPASVVNSNLSAGVSSRNTSVLSGQARQRLLFYFPLNFILFGLAAAGYGYSGAPRLKEHLGVCEVHRRLENDIRLRMVKWCQLCGAWLCEECAKDWVRRMRAALKVVLVGLALLPLHSQARAEVLRIFPGAPIQSTQLVKLAASLQPAPAIRKEQKQIAEELPLAGGQLHHVAAATQAPNFDPCRTPKLPHGEFFHAGSLA